MKFPSRGVRGRQLAPKTRSEETRMKGFPWKNPLKGGYQDIAMAEVSVKSAGVYVGIKVKF